MAERWIPKPALRLFTLLGPLSSPTSSQTSTPTSTTTTAPYFEHRRSIESTRSRSSSASSSRSSIWEPEQETELQDWTYPHPYTHTATATSPAAFRPAHIQRRRTESDVVTKKQLELKGAREKEAKGAWVEFWG